MVHSDIEFEELCGFLDNPNYIITSSTGRNKACQFPVYAKGNSAPRNNLKVVYSGTKEFKIASARRDLFLAFSEHQERLLKRLALDEKNDICS
ncbi:unnamed protein product [Sphenostylis stenocarpa]|uniref:Uncharacterized protein n=1 Tax=Sphenostylis stenocarpa TaxID=92480 RepID=A0AA86SLT2_9FABA|nr:unnamed protein product [Sphenostylis stenocarpa]